MQFPFQRDLGGEGSWQHVDLRGAESGALRGSLEWGKPGGGALGTMRARKEEGVWESRGGGG